MEELKEIRALKQKMLTFMEYRHKLNNYMQGQYEEAKIDISNVPTLSESLFTDAYGAKQQ